MVVDENDRPVVPRPGADRRPARAAIEWLSWVGLPRVVLAAVSVAIVGAGGWWLTRAPAPGVEEALPIATQPVAPVATTIAVSPSTTLAPAWLTVHVAGAVEAPGVYQLAGTARVDDAVAAAGGAVADAELDALNLAAPLADGQRIFVPLVGDVDPATVAPIDGEQPVGADAAAPATGPVDVNRADATQLETLPGVGPATAAAIIDERERNGPFAGVDDLDRVPGIGPAKLDAIRDLVIT